MGSLVRSSENFAPLGAKLIEFSNEPGTRDSIFC